MTIAARWQKFRARMKADSRKGSAAIEFAFVAPIFFTLLLGTFEAAIMFFSQAALQNAVTDMARQIRTGQVANTNMDQAAFRTALCAKVTPLIACDTNLQIDVQAYPGYNGVTFASGLQADNTLDPSLNRYAIGAACQVVLVRAYYTWPVVTPVLSWFLVNMAGDKHLLTAAAAFRNEPFVNDAAGC